MEKKYFITGDKMHYLMPKELDHHCAKILSVELDSLITTMNIRHIVFDFIRTEFMDSSGIGVVIGRSRQLHYLNGEIKVVNLSDRIRKIFKAAGLFRIVKNEEIENGISE